MEDKLLAELKSIQTFLAAAHSSLLPQQYLSVNGVLEKLAYILTRPMRIAVLGEENSGKSLLINYFLKHQVLPSGGFSGDSTELFVHYASEPTVYSVSTEGNRNRLTSKAFGRLAKPETPRASVSSQVVYDGSSSSSSPVLHFGGPQNPIFAGNKNARTNSKLLEVGLPLNFLKQIEFIEVRAFPDEKSASPLNRVFRRVDAAIWCTLATQAWKETEILTWKSIPPVYRKSALLFVTYKDAIRRGKDEAKILARLRHATASFFDDVMLVSLRDAVQSLLCDNAENADRCRMESNIQAAEASLAKIVMDWKMLRLRKASRILQRAAVVVAGVARGREMMAMLDIAARLDRLANDVLDFREIITGHGGKIWVETELGQGSSFHFTLPV